MPYMAVLLTWNFRKAIRKVVRRAVAWAQESPKAGAEEQCREFAHAHGKTTFEAILQCLLWVSGCDCVEVSVGSLGADLVFALHWHLDPWTRTSRIGILMAVEAALSL